MFDVAAILNFLFLTDFPSWYLRIGILAYSGDKNLVTNTHTHRASLTHKLQKNAIIWHTHSNHLENKITTYHTPKGDPPPFPALLLCFKCQPHVLSFYESILLARGYLFENAKIGICSKMQRFLSLLSIHRKKSNAKTHSNIRIE